MEAPSKGLIAYRKNEVDDDNQYRVAAKPSKKNTEGCRPRSGSNVEPLVKKDRLRCGCGGCDHEVFSNCMGCGRILCIKEGEGPCFHCGALVFSASDIDKIPKEYADDPEFIRAMELRDRLLALDANYATNVLKVHDLNSDWFREVNNIYNENPDHARMKYYEEERAKRIESEIRRYDIDLGTGSITLSGKPRK